MPAFVELVTDAFEQTFRQQAANKRGGGSRTSVAGNRVARRPLRGIEIKEDTYSIIKVVRADGREIPLFDSSSRSGRSSSGYANFLLKSAQEARMEKHQIVETFGDAYIFFFGENPRFVDYSAVLLNTHDFNWRAEWWENYERYLRGTRLVEMGARVYIFYDDIVVEGYILNAAAMEESMAPYQVMLQFRLFITNYQNLSFVEAPDNAYFPTRSSISLPDGISLTATGAAEDLVSVYRGEAFDAANQENFGRSLETLSRSFDGPSNTFVSGRKISDYLRAAPRSFAVSEQVWSNIINNPAVNPYTDNQAGLITRNGQPIRSFIADNVDEYTGRDDQFNEFSGDDATPAGQVGTVRSTLECEDLFRTAIEALSCYGLDINSPEAVNSLGMGPNFGSSPAPTGSPVTQQGAYSSYGQDPLASVYGRAEANVSLGTTSTPEYGYTSDFANGQPGYGAPGYGDFGGPGYGSSMGATGDPGFKDPSQFTFAGVNDARGAFARFMTPKQDTTVFGGGMGIDPASGGSFSATSSATTSIGASSDVGGSVSAFAFVSVGGTLDPTGLSRYDPATIAQKQADQKFGFSNDNPFGVSCAPTADGTVTEEDLSNPYT